MDFQACTDKIRRKLGENSGLDTTLKLDCGADGVIYIDALATPNTITHENKDAACTITISTENLSGLLSGELNPMGAFMTGKIKVSGDMTVALKLQPLFG